MRKGYRREAGSEGTFGSRQGLAEKRWPVHRHDEKDGRRNHSGASATTDPLHAFPHKRRAFSGWSRILARSYSGQEALARIADAAGYHIVYSCTLSSRIVSVISHLFKLDQHCQSYRTNDLRSAES
jgi:hypothetical protein